MKDSRLRIQGQTPTRPEAKKNPAHGASVAIRFHAPNPNPLFPDLKLSLPLQAILSKAEIFEPQRRKRCEVGATPRGCPYTCKGTRPSRNPRGRSQLSRVSAKTKRVAQAGRLRYVRFGSIENAS